MFGADRTGNRSSVRALLTGVGAGVAVIAVYIVTGLLFADWHPSEFLTNLSLSVVGEGVSLAAFVIAGVAIPIALYLRHRLVFPLVALLVVSLAWFAYGFLIGTLTSGGALYFTAYLFMLAPVLGVLFLLIGGGEYYARTRSSPR